MLALKSHTPETYNKPTPTHTKKEVGKLCTWNIHYSIRGRGQTNTHIPTNPLRVMKKVMKFGCNWAGRIKLDKVTLMLFNK